MALCFSDLLIALTPTIDESLPNKVYLRRSFTRSRKLLVIQWLGCAAILCHAYKSTLLSTLVTIRYTEPLDTLDQMDASGLQFGVAKGTALEWLAISDPRAVVKRLVSRLVLIPYKEKLAHQNR